MAIIGTFTRTADGFSGSLKTLTLNSKLQFVPETNKSSDSAPDYRNAPSPEPRKQQGRRPCDPARDRRSLDPRLRGAHIRGCRGAATGRRTNAATATRSGSLDVPAMLMRLGPAKRAC